VVWYGSEPKYLARIWPNADKSKWWLQLWDIRASKGRYTATIGTKTAHATDEDAWLALWSLSLNHYSVFVTEAVYGPMAETLAERRGTVLVYTGVRSNRTPVLRVRTQEWRGAVVMGTELVWPEGRPAKKKFSQYLAKEDLRVELPDDVSDAYLIGKWYLLREAYANSRKDKPAQRVRRAGKPKSRARGAHPRRRLVRRA